MKRTAPEEPHDADERPTKRARLDPLVETTLARCPFGELVKRVKEDELERQKGIVESAARVWACAFQDLPWKITGLTMSLEIYKGEVAINPADGPEIAAALKTLVPQLTTAKFCDDPDGKALFYLCARIPADDNVQK